VYGSGNSKFQALGVRGVSGDGGGPDLPTSKTCKSEDFEKKAQKTWRLGPQTWRFPKYVLNENKNGRFLVSSILYLIRATYYILLLHFLSVSVSLSMRGASLN